MAKTKKKSSKSVRAPMRAKARPASPAASGPRGPWAILSTVPGFLGLVILAAALMLIVVRPPAQTVSVDFLYSQTCDYCVQAKPIVEASVARMNGQVQLQMLDAGLRSSDPALAQTYQHYKDTGLFGGFPTLVAHGPNGDAALVGLRSPEEVHAWLCAQFTRPPAGCSG